MFKPQYQLTPELLSCIAQTERLYGQLDALRIPQKLEVNLQRDNLLNSSYISNSIEGNPLSLAEVTNLLLQERIPVNRNEKEVKNYFEILKTLNEYINKPINLEMVCQIHKRLLSGVEEDIAGEIRNEKIVIGKKFDAKGKRVVIIKHEPPFHEKTKIKKAIEELLDWLKGEQNLPAAIKSGIFHHQFVYLHPFVDGNGRVCRLLTSLIFLKSNFAINKYFVLDDYYDLDREMYSDKLHSADKGDKTEWLEYFSKGIMYSLQSALSRIQEGLKRLSMVERPTPREREVLKIFEERKEVTSTNLAEILNISRQQAYNLLNGLTEKGFVARKGKTKGSYYFLK